ncbi:MAG: hypothetical protein ACLRRK_11575 [Parasutterella sp.]
MKKVLFLVCLIAASLSFNVSAGEKAKFGAERHAEHGVDCAQCHGEKNELPHLISISAQNVMTPHSWPKKPRM